MPRVREPPDVSRYGGSVTTAWNAPARVGTISRQSPRWSETRPSRKCSTRRVMRPCRRFNAWVERGTGQRRHCLADGAQGYRARRVFSDSLFAAGGIDPEGGHLASARIAERGHGNLAVVDQEVAHWAPPSSNWCAFTRSKKSKE